jgi:hypothetical protein
MRTFYAGTEHLTPVQALFDSCSLLVSINPEDDSGNFL